MSESKELIVLPTDKKRRGQVNRAARDAIAQIILQTSYSEEWIEIAQAIVEAIARHEIPHVGITY